MTDTASPAQDLEASRLRMVQAATANTVVAEALAAFNAAAARSPQPHATFKPVTYSTSGNH